MSAPIVGMFSPFILESGISPLAIGLTFASFFLACNLFEIPSSLIADKFSRKKVIMASSVMFIFCNAIFLLSQSQSAFIIHMVLAGIGVALFSGTIEALIYDELKAIGKEEKYQKALSFYHIAFSLGLSTALFSSSFLMKHGYYVIIVVSLALSFTSLLIFTLFMKETPRTKTVDEAHSFREIFVEGRKTLLHNKTVRYLALISIVYGALNCTLGDMAIITAMELGWLKENIARIFGFNTIFEAIITYLFVRYFQNTSVKVMKNIMFFVVILVIVGMFFGKWWSIFMVFPLWWMDRLKNMVFDPKIQAQAKSSSRATTTSCISMAFGMNYCILMIILGAVAQYYSWTAGFITISCIGFAGILGITRFLKT